MHLRSQAYTHAWMATHSHDNALVEADHRIKLMQYLP